MQHQDNTEAPSASAHSLQLHFFSVLTMVAPCSTLIRTCPMHQPINQSDPLVHTTCTAQHYLHKLAGQLCVQLCSCSQGVIAVACPTSADLSLLGFQEGLRSSQASDGHAQWRAGNVVQFHCLEQLNGLGVSTVLSADAQLDVGPGGAATIAGDAHQLPHTHKVDGLKRIQGEDAVLGVELQELGLCIITADAEGLRGSKRRAGSSKSAACPPSHS